MRLYVENIHGDRVDTTRFGQRDPESTLGSVRVSATDGNVELAFNDNPKNWQVGDLIDVSFVKVSP